MLRKVIVLMALVGVWPIVGAAQPSAKLDKLSDAVEPQVIAWRRYLHQHPELSYAETQTAAYIATALRSLPGIEVQTGVGRTGVKAVLKGGRPGPVVALRSDMDGLPVEERNALPFRSTARAMWQGQETGVMHACGHDAHMAMLLGAAQILAQLRDELPGTVVFLFQPAEEWGGAESSPSGAYAMVADGALENPHVDVVFGQHIFGGHPGGTINYRGGSTMASTDNFSITVKGTGGHGAMPWLSKDPIVTAAQIVTALQTIVSRQVNLPEGAAVVTVGQLHGGNRNNIIPEQATLSGTIRALNEDTRTRIHSAVTEIAQHTAQASGLTAEVDIGRSYSVLRNDPELTAKIVPALQRAAGRDRVVETPPQLASEDFGAFSTKVPGVFWFLNASPYPDRAGAGNHSPLFEIDEQYLKTGVRALVSVTLDYLETAAAEAKTP